METKTHIILEVKKGDNTFSYHMPAGSPFGQAYDACFEILQKLIEYSHKATETLKQPEAEEPKS
jgi:hypothetical protein